MDGLRKVPDNVPNKEMMAQHPRKAADRSARSVRHVSRASAHHNNARLREFLDRFGFDYEFLSSTEYYKAGRFDEALLTCSSATTR